MQKRMRSGLRREKRGVLPSIGEGVAAGILAELAVFFLLSVLTLRGVIPEKLVAMLAAAGAALGAAVGAFLGASRAMRLALPSALGTGAGIWMLHFALGVLIRGEAGVSAVISAAIIAGAAAGGIISAMKGAGKSYVRAALR